MGLSNKLSVRLGVSPATATPTDFYSQRFWDFISLHWNPGFHSLFCSPVVLPSLSSRKCGTAPPTSCCLTCLALQPLLCWVSSQPCLPVSVPLTRLNECFFNSLIISDFHRVWFSGSSGYFLFLNLLLSFFWLCKVAKCIYLHFHLGQKSCVDYFNVELYKFFIYFGH